MERGTTTAATTTEGRRATHVLMRQVAFRYRMSRVPEDADASKVETQSKHGLLAVSSIGA